MSAKASPSVPSRISHSPKDPSPQVKTSVGITYAVLSEAILSTVKSAKPGRLDAGRLAPETLLKFKDALFLSPRLTQWEHEAYPNGYEQWRIYANDDTTCVIVDKKDITIHKGERSVYLISDDPLIATSLFSALEQAQRVVSTAVALDEPMSDEEQESYFDNDVNSAGAGLDEALADTHAEPLCVDDADLIHDVTVEDELNEDQRKQDGPEPIVTVSQQFIEDISNKKYVNKSAAFVDAEVTRVKDEYPELKGDKLLNEFSNLNKGKAPVGTRSEINRFKSLQGRILTIMDASIADKDQRAAVKSLISKEFRHTMNQLDKSEGE